jgi:hypothetical protein
MHPRRSTTAAMFAAFGLVLFGCENDVDPTEEVPPVEAPREEETS